MRYSIIFKFILLTISCVFTQEYNMTYVEVPEPSPEALSYYKSGNVLWGVNFILGFLIPLLFYLQVYLQRLETGLKN